MEELHSSAALDEEIRSDARRKAEYILRKADEECKKILDGVQERIEGAVKSAFSYAQDSAKLLEENINATLPLEKNRYRVDYVRQSVLRQINSYLENLSEEKKLEIITGMLKRYLPALEGSVVKAYVAGIKPEAAKKLLESQKGITLASCEKADDTLFDEDSLPGLAKREGIILITEDKSLRCRLTLDEKIREVLDENNLELSSALFCGRIPE